MHGEPGSLPHSHRWPSNAEHRQIGGAGHYPAEQRPDLVNAALIAFLDDRMRAE